MPPRSREFSPAPAPTAARDERLPIRSTAARDRYEQALRDIVRRGIAAGEFRPVDAKLAVFAILGAINWIARWFSARGSVRPPELGAQFADHLVRGLLAA